MKFFLTDNDRTYLRMKHRQMKEKRYADRIKTILFLDEGFSFEKIAQWLMLDDDTIRSYHQQYEKNGIENLLKDNYKGKLSHIWHIAFCPTHEPTLCKSQRAKSFRRSFFCMCN